MTNATHANHHWLGETADLRNGVTGKVTAIDYETIAVDGTWYDKDLLVSFHRVHVGKGKFEAIAA